MALTKLERLRAVGAAHVAESVRGGGQGRLPRGISPETAARPDPRTMGLRRDPAVAIIPLDRIVRDESHPRKKFDEEALGRLADSLREMGQLQPIRVRWDADLGSYVVLCGERRWRAARLAGLDTLSCVVHGGDLSTAERLEIQLAEHSPREDFRPVEQARAYKTLMDERGLTMRELADQLHIAQASVARAVALLNLPPAVRKKVDEGALKPSVAYEISKARPADQEALAEAAVSRKLRRDQVVDEVNRGLPRPRRPSRDQTRRVFRTDAGIKVTVEGHRPLTDDGVRAALEEVLRQLD